MTLRYTETSVKGGFESKAPLDFMCIDMVLNQFLDPLLMIILQNYFNQHV